MKKRILCLVLSLLLIVSVAPMTVLAASGAEKTLTGDYVTFWIRSGVWHSKSLNLEVKLDGKVVQSHKNVSVKTDVLYGLELTNTVLDGFHYEVEDITVTSGNGNASYTGSVAGVVLQSNGKAETQGAHALYFTAGNSSVTYTLSLKSRGSAAINDNNIIEKTYNNGTGGFYCVNYRLFEQRDDLSASANKLRAGHDIIYTTADLGYWFQTAQYGATVNLYERDSMGNGSKSPDTTCYAYNMDYLRDEELSVLTFNDPDYWYLVNTSGNARSGLGSAENTVLFGSSSTNVKNSTYDIYAYPTAIPLKNGSYCKVAIKPMATNNAAILGHGSYARKVEVYCDGVKVDEISFNGGKTVMFPGRGDGMKADDIIVTTVDGGYQYLNNVTLDTTNQIYKINFNKYTITYNANGGTGTMAPVDFTAPVAVAACGFEREYYAFIGWNTRADGKGTAYAPTDIYGDQKSEQKDVTLYAQWLQLHSHSGELVAGKTPTCTENGWKDYYHCSCGKYFADKDCKVIIGDGSASALNTWQTTGAGKLNATGHNLVYTGSGNVISQVCTHADCDYEETATLNAADATYDEKAHTASVAYSDGWDGGALTITYKDGATTLPSAPVNSGTYTAVITKSYTDAEAGTSGTATATKTFTIAPKGSSEDGLVVENITGTYTYNGQAQKPTVVVKNDGTLLTEGTDYTVSYSNNKNAGTATVTVTFKGNFSGTETKNFTIGKKQLTASVVADNKTYDGSAAATVKATVDTGITGETLTISGLTGTFSNADAEDNKTVTVNKASVSYGGTANSNNYSVEIASTVKANINPKEMTVTSQGYTGTYDGNNHSITVTVTDPASGYAILYGTSSDAITSTSMPLKDACNTNVYYKVTAKNYVPYIDYESVVITKAGITPTLTMANWVYGDTASTPQLTGNSGNAIPGYSYKAAGDASFTDGIPTKAGTYTLKADIPATTNYGSATATTTFTIEQRTVTLSWSDQESVYDGMPFKPTATITNKVGSDDVSVYVAGAQTVAGEGYTATADSLLGNDAANYKLPTPKPTTEFTILPKGTMTAANVESISDQNYTGNAITPAVVVKDGEKTLTLDEDYTVKYTNNVNVGTANVEITLKGNYTGTINTTFAIVQNGTLTEKNVGTITDQTYTGSPVEPKIVIMDGSKTLEEGKDFTVTYENNVEVGTAKAVIELIGNYTGKIEKTFKIVPKKSMNSDNVSNIDDQPYTGKPIEPQPIVKDGKETLEKGKDYDVSYENNVKEGTATVIIKLKGNYSGTIKKNFKITHNGKYVPGKKPTDHEDGWLPYYECDGCKKYYEDAACTIEITDINLWKRTKGKLDRLLPDVTETDVPKTGDATNLSWWLTLLAVAFVGFVSAGVYGKKKKA